ncbi:MAG: N-acetylmuramoyl-L-alanine amidase [Firmicutes bacterium]|nr:N-acetylmuramoyl-L-alanine amidase [Bacillota bacterium]MBQ5960494.1 N-acetylmuramoyl-L-alanine amidase [Bacillota bacterium]
MAKRYRLQDPIKFITFLLMLGIFVILLVMLIRSCTHPKQKEPAQDGQASSQSSSAREYEQPADLNGQKPAEYAARQNVYFTASLVGTIYDIEQARNAEEQVKEVPIVYTIVLDPGCGGTENGNPGIGGVWEKEINLKAALALRKQIEEVHPEIRVVMTRTSDHALTGQERIDLINETKPDLAISLHCDYFAGASERRGTAAFLRNSDGAKIKLEDGKKTTVQELARQIAEELQTRAVSALETENRGVSEARYEILNQTTVPVVLIEMAYLTDQSDYDKITSNGYIKAFSEEMTEGINSVLTAIYPNRQPVLEGDTAASAAESAAGSENESGEESIDESIDESEEDAEAEDEDETAEDSEEE